MNQEQLLAQRDELAREYHLGELALYRTPWIPEGWVIYARVIAIVVIAALVLVSSSNGQPGGAIVILPLGVLFYLTFLSDDTSVYVYWNGLVCLRRSGGQVVHWEEIRTVWISGGGRWSLRVLKATLNDGTTIRFPATSSHASASLEDIRQFIQGNMAFKRDLPDQ